MSQGERGIARLTGSAILALVSLIGVAAFLYPFFQPLPQTEVGMGSVAHAQDAPLMFILLIVLSLGTLLNNLIGGAGLNAKMTAVLGVLCAINAVLRAVPGPSGFSAMFVLPILTGYCYGPTFGFLLGALSLAVSALLGAGVGPWMPYQMLALGWVGLTSGWLPRLPKLSLEVAMLCVWGVFWGLLFGFVMNIWFWPFVFDVTQAGMYWQPGIGPLETLKRYMVFYVLTSLWWDAARAGGNFLLLALFGAPILKLLRRFGKRFAFQLKS